MVYSTLRRTPLRRVNPERRAKLRERQFGPHATRIRALPCCVCGADPPSDPAHIRSRGAGGTSRDLVPLCRRCHREQHAAGIETFQRDHDVDLVDLATRLAAAADNPPRRHGSTIPRLYARLALMHYPDRLAMLRACPVRVPAPVAKGDVLELARWLDDRLLAAEVERVLDLWEAL